VNKHRGTFLVNALADAIGRQRMLYAGRNGNVKRTKLWDEFGYPDTLTFDNFYRQYRRGSTGFAAVHKLLDSAGWTPTIIDGDEDRSRPNYALGKVSHQADEEALGEN
jgi:hypothetical protein